MLHVQYVVAKVAAAKAQEESTLAKWGDKCSDYLSKASGEAVPIPESVMDAVDGAVDEASIDTMVDAPFAGPVDAIRAENSTAHRMAAMATLAIYKMADDLRTQMSGMLAVKQSPCLKIQISM